MGPTLKVPLLLVGAVATTGAGVFAFKEFSLSGDRKSISSLISQDPSKRPIDINEIEHWKKAWQSYKSSGNDIWKLGNGEEVPTELKTICSKNLESKVESRDSEDYRNFISYCSRDTLVSDLIRENASGRELIAKGAGSSEEWKAVWKQYKEHANNSDKATGKDIWKLRDWSTQNSSENAPDSFMTKCESNAKTPFHNLEGDLYNHTVSFCTKGKSTTTGSDA
ncbi:hypothetical protein MHC_04565 [Mycoplasma haemocanis str. Illinois]|uniref:Uncharacterized protein n=1 Tax=Mycoplasma haemocanis (strain Illinois) TaxID=1111676 RepID=H6N7Z7_MYCHN|nr:hypothetical protein [Mycoplasma haemocanis]AEW45769.1 hypothetical protein MHC_04565 [Mycoplasma haemocanis str. Illinois]